MLKREQLELYKRAVIMVKDGYRPYIAARECRINGNLFVQWYKRMENKGVIVDGIFNDEIEIVRTYKHDKNLYEKFDKGCEYIFKGYSYRDAAALAYCKDKSLYGYFCKKYGLDTYRKLRHGTKKENLRTMPEEQYNKILQALDYIRQGDEIPNAAKKADVQYSVLKSYISRKAPDIQNLLYNRKLEAKRKRYKEIRVDEKQEQIIVNSFARKLREIILKDREAAKQFEFIRTQIKENPQTKVNYTSFTTGGCSGLSQLNR